MISVSKCKQILKNDEGRIYTDRDIEEIREFLYMMASFQLEAK